jgi:hypothetical protein
MLQNIPMEAVPFQEWIDAIGNGTINTNLDRTFKLEHAGKAHEYMEANKVRHTLFVPPYIARPFSGVLFLCFLFWRGEWCFKTDRV